MSIVRKHVKQGTSEPRKFVIPEDLFQGNLFAQIGDLVPQLRSKQEQWPVEYTNFGALIRETATVYRFRHDVDDATIKGAIDGLINDNMSRFTQYAQSLVGPEFNYQPPYDKNAW